MTWNNLNEIRRVKTEFINSYNCPWLEDKYGEFMTEPVGVFTVWKNLGGTDRATETYNIL